jgi:hypothetical protein
MMASRSFSVGSVAAVLVARRPALAVTAQANLIMP